MKKHFKNTNFKRSLGPAPSVRLSRKYLSHARCMVTDNKYKYYNDSSFLYKVLTSIERDTANIKDLGLLQRRLEEIMLDE